MTIDRSLKLTFDDVTIIPLFSYIKSRKDVVLDKLPIISSNMDTVTEDTMARFMLSNNAFAALHRFQSIDNNVLMFKKSIVDTRKPFVSIGLGSLELERAEALYDAGAESLIIDLANGANINAVHQFNLLKDKFKNNIHITVGNFATGSTIKEFKHHSRYTPDAYKVGIGSGSACSTRVKTAIGVPQFSSLIDCIKTGENIISDGGCKTAGDVSKALAAGAKYVMLGGMLAGTDETPGELLKALELDNGTNVFLTDSDLNVNNLDIVRLYNDSRHKDYRGSFAVAVKEYKEYRGSASKESYEIQHKEASWRTPEGESMLIPYKGSASNVLKDIEGGLRSCMSYCDAMTLQDLVENAQFIEISNASYVEGTAHGKKV